MPAEKNTCWPKLAPAEKKELGIGPQKYDFSFLYFFSPQAKRVLLAPQEAAVKRRLSTA